MRIATLILAAGALLMTACQDKPKDPRDGLMSWDDLTSRELPLPTESRGYNSRSASIVDIWIPDGEGPHPVVLMIHGGCWQKSIADRTLMNYAAEDLRARGIGVWNIEYRGVDEKGGAYPGIYMDVASAADELHERGSTYRLDSSRVVAFGHSAGGHLAAWLAARKNIAIDTPLRGYAALSIHTVINSGGLADLEASAPVTLDSCLPAIMDDLTGPPSESRPNVFADTSPAELQPATAHQISVNGALDHIAPPQLGEAYTAKVIAAGGNASYVEIPGEGHVELIAPGTKAWERQVELIEAAFSETD